MAIKLKTSSALAAIMAASATLLAAVAMVLLGLLSHSLNIWGILIFSAIFFLISFFLLRYLIRIYISQRIKSLYRALYFLKPSSKENAGIKRSTDSLEQAEKNVEEWTRERKEEYQRIKQLADYRREFLGNVSHELKTPIFNIQGYIHTLLDGGLEDPNINKDYLRRAAKNVRRLIIIVNDLEEIGKLEAGEMELKMERFDIVQLTGEVIELLETKANRKDTRLSIEHSFDNPIFVQADRERIRQVLINLVDNSIKYRKKDSQSSTSIAFFEMEDHVQVEVSDNGIGLAANEIPRIFERFYRTEGGRLNAKSGSGLGLAIVKHIIEAHDQTISVRSKVDEGTTFGFTLRKS